MEQNNKFMTNAINLKSYSLSETDKIVVMYSQDKGLIRGVAKGAKKPKSKLGGRMDLLVANKLMLHKGRNLDTITQAEALNTFYNTRTDMNKMVYSLYCAEIVINFGMENDPSSEEIYDLLFGVLEQISEAKNKIEILLKCLKFQLKICQILGYGLELSNCVLCSKEQENQDIWFSKTHGGIICKDCAQNLLSIKKMNPKLQKFLIANLETNFDQKTAYDDLVDEKFAMFCFNFLKDYIANFSTKPFKTLETISCVN